MLPKVLDLFAGCGGLSSGLQMAGWEISAANEIDQWAADTYRLNHPKVRLLQDDIRSIPTEFFVEHFKGNIDLIAGGPPCQGFSISGKRQYGHVKEQNSLVEEFVRVVAAVRPKLVLIENVGGFRTGEIKPGNPVMEYLSGEFAQMGYEMDFKIFQAADFGVPSLRTRLFIVASRVGFTPDFFPNPTHSKDGVGATSKYISLWEAIGDLPVLSAGQGEEGPVAYTSPPLNDYQTDLRIGSSGIFNHVAMKHTARLVERFSLLPQGGRGFDIGRNDGSDTVTQVTNYKSNNQRLFADAPSLCITANFQSNYVHPFQPRNLTAREAARLMSYPDSYVFLGKRTQMSSTLLRKYGREHEDYLSQYNQIGNSVPPLLGREIGKGLLKILGDTKPRALENLEKFSYLENK